MMLLYYEGIRLKVWESRKDVEGAGGNNWVEESSFRLKDEEEKVRDWRDRKY